mmetsp:Transcript_43533/g.67902  ORF Transcript_43533/g.67902 Transcript_43533/m.67902 type:complete len:551 (+) Transcript_43533:72-1724(+)
MMVVRFVFAILCASAQADTFLKAVPKAMKELLSEADVHSALLQEIESSLGHGSATNRLALLEATLMPLFNALPKNEHGRLDHSTVRYALHRLFVMRHGWNIKGLRSDSAASNSSTPAGVLQDQVPSYVQDIFEQRLEGKGLGLLELAVLASTIEHLIHNEAAGKMAAVFKVLELSPHSILDQGEIDEALDTYMMAFVIGQNVSKLSLRKIKKLNTMMPEIFTGWRDAQQFVRRVRLNVTSAETGLDLASITRVVEVVGEEYGSFQNIECQELKHTLMKIEDRGTGRVKLAEFYKPALNGAWQFQESVSYLRQLGALDESDPTSISVIIPNYLHSQTNCIASSGFYSVCCKDECETLLGHIEEKIVAPEANPSAIISLVRNLPSPTVSAPRDISPTLSSRLEDIAAHHGGTIPLHGRLFAQWLHHAFPRECPYPHLSGTTSQSTSDEWIAESGALSEATEEEMRQFTDGSSSEFVTSQQPVAVEELLTWSTEEELLVVRPKPQMAGYAGSVRVGLRSLMMFGAVCSLAFGLVKSFRVSGRVDAIDQGKFLV